MFSDIVDLFVVVVGLYVEIGGDLVMIIVVD